MSDTRNDELSTKEAAAIAGVDKSTMREWCYKGWVPYTKTKHGQIRIARQDLERYLATRQQSRQAAPKHSTSPRPQAVQHEDARAGDATARLTRQDVAQRAGIHLATVDKWVRKGALTRHGVKGHTFYDAAELERVLATRQQPAQASGVQTALPWAAEAKAAKQPVRTPPVAQQPAPAASGPAELVQLREKVEALTRERAILHKELAAAYDRERQAQDRELRLFRLLEHVYEPTPPRTLATRTLSDRVLEHLREVGTARTPKQVQQALGSSRSVERVLRYLVDRGDVYRPRPGWFQAMPTPDETKQERILAYLRREGRPRLAVQVQAALGLDEPPYNDLVRLQQKALVEKVRRGLYRAVSVDAPFHDAPVSSQEADDLG